MHALTDDQSGRPDLGFLGPSLFRFGNPRFWGWISLDFLGFSCPNLDLSMGYAGKTLKLFFYRFVVRDEPPKRLAHDVARGGGELLIKQA
jgi:hypothetical protein